MDRNLLAPGLPVSPFTLEKCDHYWWAGSGSDGLSRGVSQGLGEQ